MPLPITEDPFNDDLGYGAAIHVVSTNVRNRLTWSILKDIMQGLWNFLVDANRYLVRELETRLEDMIPLLRNQNPFTVFGSCTWFRF